MTPSRNVTEEAHDPRDRFGLYRLCDCPTCEGKGKVERVTPVGNIEPMRRISLMVRCSDCRGEGRVRQEVASCESPEAVGVALVTLAREGEWEECPFGLLDRHPTQDCNCPPGMRYHALNCQDTPGLQIRKWLVLPWLPSPRNVRDAAKLLRAQQ